MITTKEAQDLPLDVLKNRIEFEETKVKLLWDLYKIRCEQETLRAAEKQCGIKKEYMEIV